MPIPGTTKLERLKENVAAAEVELTAEDLALLRRELDATPVQGERYRPVQGERYRPEHAKRVVE